MRSFPMISIILTLLLMASAANAAVNFERCEVLTVDDCPSLSELTCKQLLANAEYAQQIFMKSPYTKLDDSYREGMGWSNAQEELAVGLGYIMYHTKDGEQTAQLVTESLGTIDLAQAEPDFLELEFSSSKAVCADVEEKLAKLGIHAKLLKKTSFTGADLQARYDLVLNEASGFLSGDEADQTGQDYLDMYAKADWTENDACYVLYYGCMEQGCVVSLDGYYSDIQKANFPGTSIVVVYSREGIIHLDAHGLYEIVESNPNPHPLIDSQEAAAILQRLYSFYDVDVYYMRRELVRTPIYGNAPHDLFRLTPAWVCTEGTEYDLTVPGVVASGYAEGEQIPTSFLSLKDFAYLDARTGEEI